MHCSVVPATHQERHGNPARVTVNGCCATDDAAHAQRPDSTCTLPLHTGPSPFQLFREGDAPSHAMLHAIGNARDTLRLEPYIFADDELGRMFAESLVSKAGEGVDVRLLIDAAGSLFSASTTRPVLSRMIDRSHRSSPSSSSRTWAKHPRLRPKRGPEGGGRIVCSHGSAVL